MDLEGAAFTRIDVGTGTEVDSFDFRGGFLLTRHRGLTGFKLGFYHISSHIGDEFLQRNPNFERRDYVRESLIAGVIRNLTDDVMIYGEVGYVISRQGGAKPWEFQFGAEYNPPYTNGWRGMPFAAVNGHLRQDFQFGGSINIVGGWQWRGIESGHALRYGVQYFNGTALQYEFFDKHEEWLGTGMWLDF